MLVFAKWILAGILSVTGAFSALVWLMSTPSAYQHTLENSQLLERQFLETAKTVAMFRSEKGRFPNDEELSKIQPNYDEKFQYEIHLRPNGFNFCEKTHLYENPSNSNFVLTAWRGEWWECYRSSDGMNSLSRSPDDFSLSGHLTIDRWLSGLLAITCFLSAFFVARTIKRGKQVSTT